MKSIFTWLLTFVSYWGVLNAQRPVQHPDGTFLQSFESPVSRPSVELRYEALCPFCQRWIVTQLSLALEAFPNQFDLKLLPYGNVRILDDGTKRCQHGDRECGLNIIHSCAIHLLGVTKAVKFLMCMEKDPAAKVEDCAPAEYISTIHACAVGPEGKALWDKIGEESERVPYEYVPWVTINGAHSKPAEADFIKTLCDLGLQSNVCREERTSSVHLRLLSAPAPQHSNRY